MPKTAEKNAQYSAWTTLISEKFEDALTTDLALASAIMATLWELEPEAAQKNCEEFVVFYRRNA